MVNNPHSSNKLDSLLYLEAAILLTVAVNIFFVFPLKIPALATCGLLAFMAFILLILDYLGNNKNWMSYLFVILSGLLIGVVQGDLLISVSVLMALAIRMAKINIRVRSKLMLLMVVFLFVGLAVSNPLLLTDVNRFQSLSFISENLTIQYAVISLVTIIITFIEFNGLNHKYHKLFGNQIEFENRILEQTRTTNSLTRFIPNQIWQAIIKDNTPANLFNKRAKLTIFFSDIVGFTELSDSISADVLTEILNTYMDRMTVVAKRHNAVLDKFIGDGMMCFFGADGHNSVKQNALACVSMALDMRREMRDLRRQWQREGFAGLYVRIGINTGFCHVGNFGTDLRMSYTAIGKEVNLASRLESVAKADEIFISQATYDYICYEYDCEIVGNVKLKGFESPVTCWRVLEPVTSGKKSAQWVDYDLPGFNLHLNFKDIKNYDYEEIRQKLETAIERVNHIEATKKIKLEQHQKS